MCVALQFEPEAAIDMDPHEPGSDPGWRERIRRLSAEEIHAEFLEWNAAQPVPWPVCPECDSPFNPEDCGDFRRHLCASCETAWILALMSTLLKGSKEGRRKARRDLKRLRRELKK